MNTVIDSNAKINQSILQPADRTEVHMPSGLAGHIKDLFKKGPRRSLMLNVTVQNLGDVSILHCRGRILAGNTNLYNTALSQKDCKMLVLDLAQVDGIDAGGLGVLLDVRAWAEANGIQLRLLNVLAPVQKVLDSTRLNLVFETCSVREMFHLLGRAHGIETPLNRHETQSNSPDRRLNGGHELQKSRN